MIHKLCTESINQSINQPTVYFKQYTAKTKRKMHLTFTKKKYYNTKPRRNGSPCKNKRIYGESVQDQQKATN